MLVTPPGVTKRRIQSSSLDEAGAAFEALYKKYLPVYADNLQKRAEDYLVKSFYKSAANNNAETCTADLSKPQTADGSQSPKWKCVPAPDDNDATLQGELNNEYKGSRFVKKESSAGNKDVVEKNNQVAAHSGVGHNLDTMPDHKDHEGWERAQDAALKKLEDEIKIMEEKARRRKEKEEQDIREGKVKPKAPKQADQRDVYDCFGNDLFGDPIENLEKTLGSMNEEELQEVTKGYKKFYDMLMRQSGIGRKKSGGTRSEGSEGNQKDELSYLTIKEVGDTHKLEIADEFLSPVHEGRGTCTTRETMLAKSRELMFISAVCALFQILLALFLFGGFFLFYSFPAHVYGPFVKIIFPFLIHFSVFYVAFAFTNLRLKRSLLIYANDFTVEVLNKRLKRELSFKQLGRVAMVADRFLVVVALVIACLPVTFTNDFADYTFKEYFYLALIVVYVLMHIAFTVYYFNVQFKKLLANNLED